MAIVAMREVAPGLRVTVKATVCRPLPPAGLTMVSQGAALIAVQRQAVPVTVTSMAPGPAAAGSTVAID